MDEAASDWCAKRKGESGGAATPPTKAKRARKQPGAGEENSQAKDTDVAGGRVCASCKGASSLGGWRRGKDNAFVCTPCGQRWRSNRKVCCICDFVLRSDDVIDPTGCYRCKGKIKLVQRKRGLHSTQQGSGPPLPTAGNTDGPRACASPQGSQGMLPAPDTGGSRACIVEDRGAVIPDTGLNGGQQALELATQSTGNRAGQDDEDDTPSDVSKGVEIRAGQRVWAKWGKGSSSKASRKKTGFSNGTHWPAMILKGSHVASDSSSVSASGSGGEVFVPVVWFGTNDRSSVCATNLLDFDEHYDMMAARATSDAQRSAAEQCRQYGRYAEVAKTAFVGRCGRNDAKQPKHTNANSKAGAKANTDASNKSTAVSTKSVGGSESATSARRGVDWCRKQSKWRARIQVDGKVGGVGTCAQDNVAQSGSLVVVTAMSAASAWQQPPCLQTLCDMGMHPPL